VPYYLGSFNTNYIIFLENLRFLIFFNNFFLKENIKILRIAFKIINKKKKFRPSNPAIVVIEAGKMAPSGV
jgi:hypothetical protein